jgi:hypothetical protein
MTPPDNQQGPEEIALGQKLFFDGRLSVDVSCAPRWHGYLLSKKFGVGWLLQPYIYLADCLLFHDASIEPVSADRVKDWKRARVNYIVGFRTSFEPDFELPIGEPVVFLEIALTIRFTHGGALLRGPVGGLRRCRRRHICPGALRIVAWWLRVSNEFRFCHLEGVSMTTANAFGRLFPPAFFLIHGFPSCSQ